MGAKNLSPIVSMVPSGTAPITVASTTLVANLNAEKWGGQNLPSLSGNNGKVLAVNSGATALEWVAQGSSVSIGPYSFNYNSGTNKLEIIYTA